MSHAHPAHPWTSVASGALLALVWGLLGTPTLASANRFGPPWQAEVTATSTIAYSQPDRASAPVGPLSQGAILVVTGEPSQDWTPTQVGFVPSSDLTEKDDPWIAAVTVPSLSVYAKPNAQSAIRRTVQQGDLLRVTGVSPGLDGDPNTWWATTEGYVSLDSLAQTDDPWAQRWTLPSADEAPNGWWGQINSAANVRAGPTTQSPIVGLFGGGERVKVLAEEQGEQVLGSATWYRIDGGRYAGAYVHSALVSRMPDPQANLSPPPDGAAPDNTWIVVDRAAKSLTLIQNGQPLLVTYVALGEAGLNTPQGTYSTYLKFRADDMTSTSVEGSPDSYDLPNVPFTQYYKAGGYAIHGTYWHDLFGTPQSHGCINLTWADSAYVFERTQPPVPEGQISAQAAPDQATPVIILN